jgi:phage shock protein PspC (stress-responsive transcriptional regulator)
MRELQRSRDRKILGVAGGFAEYFDMDKTVWRAIWIFGCIACPPAILAYFILGILMPEAPADPYHTRVTPYQPPMAPPVPPMPEPPVPPVGPESEPPVGEPIREKKSYKQLTKSDDRWLSGVCGGVAEYFEVDPVLVRALWLASIFALGTGLALYIVLAILMPESPRRFHR